jgi:hypothetical protein
MVLEIFSCFTLFELMLLFNLKIYIWLSYFYFLKIIFLIFYFSYKGYDSSIFFYIVLENIIKIHDKLS